MTVIQFPGRTVGQVPAPNVIDGANREGLTEVVIIGVNADGDDYYASSERDERTLFLIEKFKHFILCNETVRGIHND